MFNIKKLNAISSVVYDYLPKESYLVSSHIDEGDVDAYLVRSANCNEMELDDRILAFARAGAGVNNIPIEACTNKGIAVFNTPGANANAVKELVFAGMLVASRNIIEAVEWAKTLEGETDVAKKVEAGKKQFVGPEIKGKTLGVIGLGAIGVMVANAAVSMGMDVIGYDPFISVESAWHMSRSVHRAIDIDKLLAQSDYITIHVPLMDKTRNYLSSPEFSKMKNGVVVMNFARGGLVKNSSVLEAIESGKVARYVVDFPDDEVIGKKNVITIPHLGASTPESEENCAMMAADELRKFIEVGDITNSVNMPSCPLAPPVHKRLTLIHKNLPNMVSQMTAVLSKENLNIEEMVNKSRGEVAYTVFDLNQTPSDGTLRELGAINGMIRIRQIN